MGDWKYLASNSHYVWPNPLDKLDSLAGSMISARNYSPPDSTESIPTLGYWPLLYNVSRDPGEAYNVATHNPEQVERLATQLASWKKSFYADVRDIQDAGTQRRRQ